MERRDFLEKIGIGAAFVLTTSCFGACKKENNTPTATIDFTVDLALAENASLNANGGFIIRSTEKVVVARDKDGNYVAATQKCSHQGNLQVTYNKTTNGYFCSVHGAAFDLTGKGTNATGSAGLTIYKTTLTGTKLRVFS